MKRLTWHVGSILPYASLWHTVNRAIWLNALRPKELVEVTGLGRRRGDQSLRACETMFTPSIDIPRLASILGEPRSDFRNCTFGQLSSQAAERYVIPRIRWCPECIAHGYHSILGSLRLLAKCPIHGVPLLDQCPSCKGFFPSSIHPAHFERPAICGCGVTALLLPETCRKPTLSADLTRAWGPAQKWLKDVEHVLQAQPGRSVPWLEAMHIALVPRWCEDLGISYPVCFEREKDLWPAEVEAARWTIYKARSGSLGVGAPPPPPQLDEIFERGFFKADSPETSVYRAMAKHLRRHGVRRSDRWMHDLRSSLDVVGFARKMRTHAGARAAFTEMIWARGLEPNVYLHRWPCRRVETFWPRDLRGLDDDSPYRVIAPWWASKKPWGHAVGTWVRHHGMSLSALSMWAIAQQRTREAVDTGWAAWTSDGPYFLGKVFWFARVRDGGVQFVGYLRDVELLPFRSPMRSKKERITEAALRASERSAEVRQACRGPCLTCSERDGWHVVNDLAPETSDIRLLRLRHVGRPEKFWLFERSGQFIARLISGPVQAVAASPRAAIDGLRAAVKHYQTRYPDALVKSQERPTPQDTISEEIRQRAIRSLAATLPRTGPRGFWDLPSGAMESVRNGVLRREPSKTEAAGDSSGLGNGSRMSEWIAAVGWNFWNAGPMSDAPGDQREGD